MLSACIAPAYAGDRTVREAIGVNIHFTDPQPGEMDMLAGAGFGWVRMDLAWGATEREKGVYDFRHYDTLLSNVEAKHMRALLILDYGSDIYGPGGKPPFDDEGRAAFARWAVAAVDHFKNRRVLWELWNEPNGDWFWPKHDAVDYAKLDITVDKAIRARFPRERLIGPATSGIDMPFLEACFKAGCLDYWDAVSAHPYRQTQPEDAAPEYAKLRELIARYAPSGKSIPIISGEWGYSCGWDGFNDERQSRYIVREMLTNIENGLPLSIWYDWHDDGSDPKNAEHNFGTVRVDYHPGRTPIYDPKPAYTALKTMTSVLGDFAFDTKLTAGDPAIDHALSFVRKKDRRYALWTTSAVPHAVVVPLPTGPYTVIDWEGRRRTAIADKSGLSITLSDRPVYVERGK